MTEADILKTLSQIQDPDLHRDIVSLGFIKNLKISGGAVSFEINLTTPACPVKEEMEAQAKSLVSKMPGVKSVEVKMTAQVRNHQSPHLGNHRKYELSPLLSLRRTRRYFRDRRG